MGVVVTVCVRPNSVIYYHRKKSNQKTDEIYNNLNSQTYHTIPYHTIPYLGSVEVVWVQEWVALVDFCVYLGACLCGKGYFSLVVVVVDGNIVAVAMRALIQCAITLADHGSAVQYAWDHKVHIAGDKNSHPVADGRLSVK